MKSSIWMGIMFGHLSEFTGYIGSQEVTGRYKEKMEEYGLEII